MQQQPFDWRDEPRRFSVSSLVLLAVFVGAVVLTVYIAFQMKPWDSDAAPPEVSSATEAPAAVEVSPPAEAPAPAPAAP